MSAARALVVGQGSIGRRHARWLAGLGLDVAVVSARAGDGLPRFAAIDEALAAHRPDHVVVATETGARADSLRALARAGFAGSVLAEKPLVAAMAEIGAVAALPRLHVAYQLRFLPVVRALRAALGGERVLAAHLRVGQHLDLWRPGRAVRDTYSAWRARGGGALRDLSHELDLALWLLGPWRRVAALGGRLGEITGDADDAWGILLETEGCALATLRLDLLDRPGTRGIVLQTPTRTLRADLLAGRLMVDDREEGHMAAPDDSYLAMHRAALGDGPGDACTAAEGIAVVGLIDAIERAAAGRRWVSP
jgi:predicted dehydrogenase